MSMPEAVVAVARDRAKRLDEDARAAVRELLDRRADTADADLVLWARDHEDAAALRERWARELAAAAAEATAPIWAEVDAWHDRWTVAEGLRYQSWSEDGAPFDDTDKRRDPARLAEWRKRADDERAALAAAEARLARYARHLPGGAGSLDDEIEGLWCIYCAADENGRCWAASLALSSPVLTDETRAEVWAMLDAETARRDGDEGLVAELKASPNVWAASFLGAAPWEWLGGWYDEPVRDDGRVPAGFEVATRWHDGEARWCVLRPVGPPRYLRAFARDLWRGRWRGEAVEARRGPRYLPALIMPVHRDLGRALELRRVEVNPAQMTLPGLVPVLTAGVEAVRGALVAAEALSPTVAHRLVRWIVRVAAMASSVGRGAEVRLDERAVARQTAGGVEIEIEGGFDALRQLLGITKKGSEIEAVVGVFAAHSIPWAVEHYSGGGPLLTFAHARQRPGLASHLALSVSPLLCPGMASDKAVKPADRVLVPCLPPPPLPVGSNRAHGGLLALDWLALLRLGELRAELLNDGGARLGWPTLALAAGVSSSSLDRALELWTDPATGRWVELPGGLWRLADRGDEGRAHELLVEGAAMSAAGSEAGKRSASLRQRARNRYR